jgi:ketosteroid isomerase-like protein
MRSPALLPIMGACLLAVACQPAGTSGTMLSDADRATLQALADSAEIQVRERRLPAWASQFTENAVFHPPNHPAIQGRAAILAWADSFPPLSEFRFTSLTIDGAGDMALGISGITMAFTPPGGPLVNDTAKQFVVWRRQADGTWATAAVSFSSDLPAPPPPPAPPSR